MDRCAVLILLSLPGLSFAQDRPAFDVASVKPSRLGPRDALRFECSAGGRLILRGTPLLWAVKWAYGLNDYQVSSGWPDWLNSFGTYDIEAKAEAEERVTEEQCRRMLQALFEDRFRLRMHRETKTVSAYGLVIGKNGHRLRGGGRVIINAEVKQSADEPEPPEGWTMSRLANYLAGVRDVGRPVLDQTGLPGIYGFTLNYSKANADDRPDVFTAVQEQLGLKLQAIKAPVTMFVIDHVEKPSGN